MFRLPFYFVDISTASNIHNIQDFYFRFKAISENYSILTDAEPLSSVVVSLQGLYIALWRLLSEAEYPNTLFCGFVHAVDCFDSGPRIDDLH